MGKAPCKDCMDRTPTCHTSCELYIRFRKTKDKERDKRWEIKTETNSHEEIVSNRYKRMGIIFGQP